MPWRRSVRSCRRSLTRRAPCAACGSGRCTHAPTCFPSCLCLRRPTHPTLCPSADMCTVIPVSCSARVAVSRTSPSVARSSLPTSSTRTAQHASLGSSRLSTHTASSQPLMRPSFGACIRYVCATSTCPCRKCMPSGACRPFVLLHTRHPKMTAMSTRIWLHSCHRKRCR